MMVVWIGKSVGYRPVRGTVVYAPAEGVNAKVTSKRGRNERIRRNKRPPYVGCTSGTAQHEERGLGVLGYFCGNLGPFWEIYARFSRDPRFSAPPPAPRRGRAVRVRPRARVGGGAGPDPHAPPGVVRGGSVADRRGAAPGDRAAARAVSVPSDFRLSDPDSRDRRP